MMLKDTGADVSVTNNQGETPMLTVLASGNLELATLLLSWVANFKTELLDGAGLIVSDATSHIVRVLGS